MSELNEKVPTGTNAILGPLWQQALICLSIANICFLQVWSLAPPYLTRAAESHLPQLPSIGHYVALVANEFVLALVIWIWLRWTAEPNPTIIRRMVQFLGGALLLAASGNAILSVVGGGRKLEFAVVVVAIGLVPFRSRLLPFLKTLLLSMSLIAFVNLGAAAMMSVRTDRDEWVTEQGPSRSLAAKRRAGQSRVVLVLFDEWDQVLTFEKRDPSLSLPNFDAFRRESLYAANALQPGPATSISVPAITTGASVESYDLEGPRDYRLKTRSGWSEWSKDDTVFAQANRLGVPVAIVGAFLPYCRLFRPDTAACWNWPDLFPTDLIFGPDLRTDFMEQWRMLFETKGQIRTRSFRRTPGLTSELHRVAASVAADDSYGFAYLHLNDTHRPYFFDRKTNAYGPEIVLAPADGYLSALVLADQTLGRIRNAMQKSGAWETTTTILTADHQLRSKPAGGSNKGLVPLLIHMPGQTNGLTITHPFRTTVLKNLVVELLDDRLRSPQDVSAYLSNSP